MLARQILLFLFACSVFSVFIDFRKTCSCQELDELNCNHYGFYCSWINQTCLVSDPSTFTDQDSCSNHNFCWTIDNKCEEISDCTRCINCPYACNLVEGNQTSICVSPQMAIEKCPTLTEERDCRGLRQCDWNFKENICVYGSYKTCEDQNKNISCWTRSCKKVNNTCQNKQCEDITDTECYNTRYNLTHELYCEGQKGNCRTTQELPTIYPNTDQFDCFKKYQITKWVNNACYQCENLVTYRSLLIRQLLPKDWPPVGSTTIGNSSQSVNSSTNTNSTNQTTEGGQTDTSNQNSTRPQSTTQEGSLHSQSILVRSLVIIIIMFN